MGGYGCMERRECGGDGSEEFVLVTAIRVRAHLVNDLELGALDHSWRLFIPRVEEVDVAIHFLGTLLP
eukprot:scaffold318_cov396-Prasinococcus_capsulatus_cf.AAC.26